MLAAIKVEMAHVFRLILELPILRHMPMGGGTLLGLAATGGRAILVAACVEAGAQVDGNGVGAMVAAMALLPLASVANHHHDVAMGPVHDSDDDTAPLPESSAPESTSELPASDDDDAAAPQALPPPAAGEEPLAAAAEDAASTCRDSSGVSIPPAISTDPTVARSASGHAAAAADEPLDDAQRARDPDAAAESASPSRRREPEAREEPPQPEPPGGNGRTPRGSRRSVTQSILSEGSSLSPGKGSHHQRSSRHAMVPLSDASPHPEGGKASARR
jgi:hypothetical protein